MFLTGDGEQCLEISVPDGSILGERPKLPVATNRSYGLSCWIRHQRTYGCFIFGDDESLPIVNLALGLTITTACFDKDGTKVFWGARDGSVIVCDLPMIESRLREVGLGWPQIRE